MAIDPNNLAATATLTFSDEFSGNALNSSKWGTGYPWGAANGSTNTSQGEAQWYINADYAPTAHLGTYTVRNGVLDIKEAPADAATQSLINGYKFTSGMINSDKSFSQTYGYFEMRADIPDGQGMWPAFWLLQGDGVWPPELDVMEVVGSSPNSLVTSVHWDDGGHKFVNKATEVPGLSSGGMHTYGVDWQADTITWYLDGKEVFEAPTPADMHKPMYMLANLAAGGAWAGQPGNGENHMLIDHIRAYSEKPTDGGGGGGGSGGGGQNHVELPWTEDPSHTVTGSGPRLIGGARNDLLVGEKNISVMKGVAGDDTYSVEHGRNVVVEAKSDGVDLVRTTLSKYALTDHVENLQLNGSGPQIGVGNRGDNYLLASASNEAHLSGHRGDDTLVAKYGPATMRGGRGEDTFRFDNAPSQAGHVTDFKPGTDTLDLRNLLKSVGYSGTHPLGDHDLTLAKNGSGGTDVALDVGAGAPIHITSLDHVLPSQLHHGDWLFA